MAAAERIERGNLDTGLPTLLAHDIVDAILDGRQPPELGLPRLLAPFPLAWGEQRALPGASARPEPTAAGLTASGGKRP
jgi:hypothetical protein